MKPTTNPDKLSYGIAAIEAIKISQEETFLDDLYNQLITVKLPEKESSVIETELKQLKECTELLLTDETLLARYRQYDHSLDKYYNKLGFDNDTLSTAKLRNTIQQLFTDVRPLVYKLKFFYDRPRPAHFLKYHPGISFYPFGSLTANCPAFPSMHSTIGYVIAGVISVKMPDIASYFQQLAEDIYHSRMYMGVCLSSDVEFGKKIAEQILLDKEFRVKYGL